MKKSVYSFIICILLFLSDHGLFAQNIGQNSIADSIISNALNEQVRIFLEKVVSDNEQNKDINSNENILSLYENIKIAEKESPEWLDALIRNKLNMKDKFINPIVMPSVQSLYKQFLSAYSEGRSLEAVIYYYRADYLRITFILSERKRIINNYKQTAELIKGRKYIEARQIVDEFRKKDADKLDYLLLRDSLTNKYQQIENKLWEAEEEAQWPITGYQDGRWRFSFGADYCIIPVSVRVPWYFQSPKVSEIPPQYTEPYMKEMEESKAESQVNYSVTAIYCINRNIGAGIDAAYSTSSFSYQTNYFPPFYKTWVFICTGKANLQKFSLGLSGQYCSESTSGILTYLKLGGGVCWRKIDEITADNTIDDYKPITIETTSTPRISTELGFGKLFGQNGSYVIAATCSVIHNFKQISFFTETEVTVGVKLMLVIR